MSKPIYSGLPMMWSQSDETLAEVEVTEDGVIYSLHRLLGDKWYVMESDFEGPEAIDNFIPLSSPWQFEL